ncbi:MAG: hypothetical protein COB15_12830 [Flavobacteriales bacterium]|nr:MAG: hypothetical protein COB15_12830 [Flavobacteriales bacterium]
MSYQKNTLTILLILLIFCGCSKEEEEVKPYQAGSYSTVNTGSTSSGGGETSNSCTSVSAQTTISNNGVSYSINALSHSSTDIGIEVVNQAGAFAASYSMEWLQVINGANCYQSSSSTELSPGFGKFFEFKNMPSWSTNSSTVAEVKIILNGTAYYIKDLHLDQ